jgi:hypothetical protein
MRFFITCDANIESKLDEVLDPMNDLGFDEYFAERYYDDSGINITVVLMCRDPYLNFKQRIRFSKNENKLYMDIMLDFNQMKYADSATRKRIVAEKLINEVPQIIAKYKFKDFDLKRFSSDLRGWFEQQGWVDKQQNDEW